MELRPYDFFLVRYIPNPMRKEFINIGVIVRDADRANSVGCVCFTRSWSRVRCLDPEADIEMLEALEKDWKEMIELGKVDQLLKECSDSLSLSLEVFGPSTRLGEDLPALINELMLLYVEPAV